LPKIKECEIPELEWLYPQNVHLHENGSNDLVPKLTIDSLKAAFEGRVYPYWKEDFLDICIVNEVVQEFEDKEIKITCHFVGHDNVGGPFVEIKGGNEEKDYLVKFIDNTADEVIYQDTIKSNHWAAASRKYYTDWSIEIFDGKKLIYKHKMNLENKRVLVSLDSKSLGDDLSWIPSVLEFRKKHKCEVFCSTFFNNILDYPDINFIEPGSPYTNIYAKYVVGCFDGDVNRNKNHWRTIKLQQIASDILGLKYEETRPCLKKFTGPTATKIKIPKKKYVVIAPHSTMQAKYWINSRWNEVVKYLKKLDYEVLSLALEPNELDNVIWVAGAPIEDAIKLVKRCEFTMTTGNGIAWLSFALGIPNILISGFSDYCEFKTKNYRVMPKKGSCHGCFNNVDIKFDRSDWNWCENAKRGGIPFECAQNISVGMVIKEINRLRNENNV
jgi:autotransporter strand-loop-strand O-heptosyltransferase